MWDDSYDSSPPSVDKRKGPGQRSQSMYDFPTSKIDNSKGLGKKKSSQNDIDALFSSPSTSENNSPVERALRKPASTYDILEPAKPPEDLLTHLVTSGDFEDSILGELLGGGGGGSKKASIVDPPKPLEPPLSSRPSTSTAPRPGGKSPTASSSRNAFRFTTEASPSSSTASPAPMGRSRSPLQDSPAVPPTFGAGRPHTNSIDIDYMGSNSPAGLSKPMESTSRPATQSSFRSRPTSSLFSSSAESLPTSSGPPSFAVQQSAPFSDKPPVQNDDEVDMGGFVPSAMEGRRGRRGRLALSIHSNSVLY